MRSLAATFDIEYKRTQEFIKLFNNLYKDFFEVKYNSNFDEVRGSAQSIMAFIGYLSDSGEESLLNVYNDKDLV